MHFNIKYTFKKYYILKSTEISYLAVKRTRRRQKLSLFQYFCVYRVTSNTLLDSHTYIVHRFASNHGKFNIEQSPDYSCQNTPPHSYTQKKIQTAAKTLRHGPWRYLQKCDHNNIERELVGFAVRALILAAKTKRDPHTTTTNLSPHTVMLILITPSLSSFLSLLPLL